MAYPVKIKRLSGTSYAEIERQARAIHNTIAKRTKRNAFVRSLFFRREKIFISLYWQHLNQKRRRDRKRRLQYYACAIDLLLHSNEKPEIRFNPNGKKELVYRFSGIAPDGCRFFVQVKEDNRTKRKHFISAFPAN